MQFSELISQGRLKDCNENHREFGYRQEVNQIHIGRHIRPLDAQG
jgi:hypothetical protein